MQTPSINCTIIPSAPLPLVLPTACVAQVLDNPEIELFDDASTNWMHGHTTWRKQRLPVLDFAALLGINIEPSEQTNPQLVVLYPIPNAARKAYSSLICYGDVQQMTFEPDIELVEHPKTIDKRYIDGVIGADEQHYIVPKLVALGVAFSYF